MAETGLATRSIFVLGVQVNEQPVISEASNMESLPIRQETEKERRYGGGDSAPGRECEQKGVLCS